MAFTPMNINLSTGQAEITGNITSATKWTTARTITVGNTGKLIDGSSNVSYSLDEIGTYSKSVIDNKVNNAGNGIGNGTYKNLGMTQGVTYTNNTGKPMIVNCFFLIMPLKLFMLQSMG